MTNGLYAMPKVKVFLVFCQRSGGLREGSWGSGWFQVVPGRFRVVPASPGRFRVGSAFYIHARFNPDKISYTRAYYTSGDLCKPIGMVSSWFNIFLLLDWEIV